MVIKTREYSSLKKLQEGEIIEIDSIKVRKIEGEIEPGDLYVGERNTGPHLLTCRENSAEFKCIYPVEKLAYPYDTGECVKVEMVE